MTDVTTEQDMGYQTLFEALVLDGFKRFCFGPEREPYALVASYEWDDYLDVITVRADGLTAAARLCKPADPLDPPRTAVWTWVGFDEDADGPNTQAESGIWAMLDLSHPNDPDAPHSRVETPAALRIPPEHQKQMKMRQPVPGSVHARAARLIYKKKQRRISEEFLGELFRAVDSNALISVADNFTPDGVLHFSNYPPITGRTAIAEFTRLLFTLANGIDHKMRNFWRVGYRQAFTEGEVTFTRLDNSPFTVPFATASWFNEDGNLLTEHHVYVNETPLMVGAMVGPDGLLIPPPSQLWTP